MPCNTQARPLTDTRDLCWKECDTLADAFVKALSQAGIAAELWHYCWPGANLHSKRRKAAVALRKKLDALEKLNVPYHLIGHSHGGSIIWEALCDAAHSPRPQLRNLQTWATVGTPFLLPNPSLANSLWRSLCSILFGWGILILVLVAWLSEAISQAVDGHYIPLAVGSAVALSLVILLRPRDKSVTAMQRFGGRWLGIISSKDEAFHLLRRALAKPTVPRLVPPWKPAPNRFLEGSAFARWIFYPVYPLWNVAVVPLLDWLVRSLGCRYLVQWIRGEDDPLGWASKVGVCPLFHEDRLRYVDDGFTTELEQLADESARGEVRRLRNDLVGFYRRGRNVLPVLDWLLMGSTALVHNCYFRSPRVLALLVRHIQCGGSSANVQAPDSNDLSRWLKDWYGLRDQAIPAPARSKPKRAVYALWAAVFVLASYVGIVLWGVYLGRSNASRNESRPAASESKSSTSIPPPPRASTARTEPAPVAKPTGGTPNEPVPAAKKAPGERRIPHAVEPKEASPAKGAKSTDAGNPVAFPKLPLVTEHKTPGTPNPAEPPKPASPREAKTSTTPAPVEPPNTATPKKGTTKDVFKVNESMVEITAKALDDERVQFVIVVRGVKRDMTWLSRWVTDNQRVFREKIEQLGLAGGTWTQSHMTWPPRVQGNVGTFEVEMKRR
jgi:hypothetical protein